jgi:hypothetical protein
MGSLSLPTPAEGRAPRPAHPEPAAPQERALLVVGRGGPVAADYAAWAGGKGQRPADVVDGGENWRRADAPAEITDVVLFLGPRLGERDRQVVDDLLALAGERGAKFVGVVSSFRAHFGDRAAAEAEEHVLGRARGLSARTVVFRPGHVLSCNSPARVYLRRFGPFYPLVPRRLRSCCVEGDELFAAIESERLAPAPRRGRLFTVLGPNVPWKDLLAQHRAKRVGAACLTAVSFLLSLLLVGQLAGLILGLLARRRPALRRWNFDTLRPRSLRELPALYNPYNYRHVKVVGYNNGVVHFGHRYPGRTVVSTVGCNRLRRDGPDKLKADCGATVRQALDFLAGTGQELHVIPNYSYVCLGTAFFVPIHGSAADFSTVADTITRAALYDPVADRLITARRDDPAFRESVYNLKADVLLLRLSLRVRPKSRYYVHREELEGPGSEGLLAALRDTKAANVEARKSNAASDKVTLSRYYNDPGEAPSPVLELPRDALGRLWDRLEENPVTSFLMHALTRHFAYHVELFFPAADFAAFWAGHRALPLRKLQLRYVRRDGFPHSPFREHDCVAVDLFMFRRHRHRFEAWLNQTFAVVRTNPGKHSR